MASHVVRPATAFTHPPKGWSHAEAATITTAGLTAWRALIVDGGLKAGETVLTMGTGGVSIAAVQIAKRGPPKRLIRKSFIMHLGIRIYTEPKVALVLR